MEGYSVDEAATVLGIPVERVWELMARGVLTGIPVEDGGMRVHLGGPPAGTAAASSGAASSPPATVSSTGEEAAEAGYPDPAMSPFRELLTEFRHLTERYGQALLALGEARGEVAGLRNRVELLEARIDLRLPASSSLTVPVEEAAPGAEAFDAHTGAEPGEPRGEAGEVEAELSREMAQQESAAPAPSVAFDEQELPSGAAGDDAGPATQRVSQPSFAEGGDQAVLAVPEPPAVAGEPEVALGPLPGAAGLPTDEPMAVPEGGYESEWDEPDWIAEEDLEPRVEEDRSVVDDVPVEASSPDAEADEPPAQVMPDAEPEAGLTTESGPTADEVEATLSEADAESEPEAEAEVDVALEAEPEAAAEPEAEEEMPAAAEHLPETEPAADDLEEAASEPAEMTLSPWGEAVPADDGDELLLHEPDARMPPLVAGRQPEDQPQAGGDQEPGAPPSATEMPADAGAAASDAYEEELMWLGDEFRPSTSGWQGVAPVTATSPGSADPGRDARQLEEMARQRGWDNEELSAIRSLLGAHPDRAGEPLQEPELTVPASSGDDETTEPGNEVPEAASGASTPAALISGHTGVTLPGADELSEAMAALSAGTGRSTAPEETISTEPASDDTGAAEEPAAPSGDATPPAAPSPEPAAAGDAGDDGDTNDSADAEALPAATDAEASPVAAEPVTSGDTAPGATQEAPASPESDAPKPAWPTTDRPQTGSARPDPRDIYRAGQEAEARRGARRRGPAASAYRRLRRLFPR